jgi:hypothetical protein
VAVGWEQDGLAPDRVSCCAEPPAAASHPWMAGGVGAAARSSAGHGERCGVPLYGPRQRTDLDYTPADVRDLRYRLRVNAADHDPRILTQPSRVAGLADQSPRQSGVVFAVQVGRYVEGLVTHRTPVSVVVACWA